MTVPGFKNNKAPDLCPEASTLQALLDGTLSEEMCPPVREHVTVCSSCDQWLSRATESPYLKEWKGSVVPVEELSAVSNLVEKLAEQTAATGSKPTINREYKTIGRYPILRKLGQGGMSQVFEGEDTRLHRKVAVKILHSTDPDRYARLIREAQAVAKLQDEHVVCLHSVETTDEGTPFLTMELVEGRTLSQLIREQGPLPVERAVSIIQQTAKGLHAAHSQGIIHRDIKPSNILLNHVDHAKLTDFGLVQLHQEDSHLTRSEELLGTPLYMSPEQAAGKEVDERSDVYSLGATLYEAVTGLPPFQGTMMRVLEQVQRDEPTAPRKLNEKIPLDVETICLKALAKESGKRYGSAMAFWRDLENYRQSLPIEARPVGGFGKFLRWVKREPRLAGAIASAFCILLAGLLVSLWQWKQVLAEREKAEQRFKDAFASVEDLTKLSEEKLLYEPGLQNLRNEILAKSATYLEKFAQERQNDPTVRSEYFRCVLRIALLRQHMKGEKEAIPLLQELLPRVREGMKQQSTEQGDLRLVYLQLLSHLALMQYHTGNYGEALSHCREAYPVCQKNGSETQLLARLLNTEGLCHSAQRNPAEAERCLKQSIAEASSLLGQSPVSTATRRNLGESHNSMGLLYASQGKITEAVTNYRSALTHWMPLLAEFPRDTTLQTGLVLIHLNLLSNLLILGQPAEAEVLFTSVLPLARKLHSDNPALSQPGKFLAKLLEFGSYAYLQQGKYQQAHELIVDPQYLPYYRQAMEKGPTTANRVEFVGGCILVFVVEYHLGQFEKVLSVVEEAKPVALKLIEEHKAEPTMKSLMVLLLTNQAYAQSHLGQKMAALESIEAALRWEAPNVRNMLELLRSQFGGNPTEDKKVNYKLGLEEIDAVYRNSLFTPALYYSRAQVTLHAAELAAVDPSVPTEARQTLAASYKKQAAEFLEKTAQGGLFKQEYWKKQATENPAFLPLRSQARWKNWIE